MDKGVNDTILKALDYLAVANYGTNTKIYRLSNLRSITAISISRRGTGYIPGIINILSEMGNALPSPLIRLIFFCSLWLSFALPHCYKVRACVGEECTEDELDITSQTR